MNLKNLKSGSDVRGTAVESDESPIALTDEAVAAVVDAFVVWLGRRTGRERLKIAVGHDSRISAGRILRVTDERLAAAGCDRYLCGLCSTPSMFMMTRYPDTRCDGSVMITASHHPYDKNGLKFFTRQGGLESADIDEILDMAGAGVRTRGRGGRRFEKDFMSDYCALLCQKVRDSCGGAVRPLEGFKIVVDAGNGAGGFYAERVLSPLGADVAGSQFLEPDGRFPNHIPNPENKTAMRAIGDCVRRNRADLGVIFDTDVDRAAIVSADGAEINRNRLIALIAAVLLGEQPGCTIVTDSVTSDGLHSFIEKRGGVHHRFKRGYKNVIDEAVRLCAAGQNAQLAIETSGHAALKENYFLDDGAYLVTRIIVKMAQLRAAGDSLDGLIADLKLPAEECEVRLGFTCGDFKTAGSRAIETIEAAVAALPGLALAPDNYEGVRVSVAEDSGWFLARMSVHDPIMVVNIESDVKGGAKRIAAQLYGILSSLSQPDLKNLKAAAGA